MLPFTLLDLLMAGVAVAVLAGFSFGIVLLARLQQPVPVIAPAAPAVVAGGQLAGHAAGQDPDPDPVPEPEAVPAAGAAVLQAA